MTTSPEEFPIVFGGPALDAILAACDAAGSDTKRRLAVENGEVVAAEMLDEKVQAARGRARRALYRIVIGRTSM
ncbi:hypothetical protein GCM10007874_45590 [Labrys miyagiensis]|uniref:Uncharacterized protein n=1 Tax=Labrys miyagiensis TaxID=346912 RepID=A0ABQ6CMF7_9HYPH|nr:hypothetical protein GCM10007874_45590 [Labrys miyagiensis]